MKKVWRKIEAKRWAVKSAITRIPIGRPDMTPNRKFYCTHFWLQLELIPSSRGLSFIILSKDCLAKSVHEKMMLGYVAITAICTMEAYFNYSQKVCKQNIESENWERSKKELQLMLSLFVSISERSSRFPSWKRIHTRRMPFCTVPLESPSTWLVSSSPHSFQNL